MGERQSVFRGIFGGVRAVAGFRCNRPSRKFIRLYHHSGRKGFAGRVRTFSSGGNNFSAASFSVLVRVHRTRMFRHARGLNGCFFQRAVKMSKIPENRIAPPFNIQLFVNGFDVRFCRLLADGESGGNFLIAEAIGQQTQHLPLARRQIFGGFGKPASRADRALGLDACFWRHPALAVRHRIQRLLKNCWGLLRRKASPDAKFEGAGSGCVVNVVHEQHDLAIMPQLAQVRKRLRSAPADINNESVGLRSLYFLEAVLEIASLHYDESHPRTCEEGRKRSPYEDSWADYAYLHWRVPLRHTLNSRITKSSK